MLINSMKYFMIVTGTWNIEWTEIPSLKTVQLWYRRFLQGMLLILLILEFAQLIQLVIINADAKVIYECFSLNITILGIGLKVFIYEKNNLSRLFQEVSNEERQISGFLDDKVVKSYNRDIKVCTYVKNCLVFMSIFLFFIFFPLRVLYYIKEIGTEQKSENERIQESLMYSIWLPDKERKNLIFVTVLNALFLFITVNLYFASHIIFFTLMIFAAAELKIIQGLIQNLESTDNKKIDHYTALRKIAQKHFSVISFVKKLNNYTRYGMLTDCLVNSINIASVATAFLMQNKVKDLSYSLVQLLTIVLYVFLLGWFGNEIKVQSLAIGDELYQTKWYTQNKKTQKLIVVIIHQSQQPLTLSIGPFGPMILETALKTLQAAYSYITFMRNLK